MSTAYLVGRFASGLAPGAVPAPAPVNGYAVLRYTHLLQLGSQMIPITPVRLPIVDGVLCSADGVPSTTTPIPVQATDDPVLVQTGVLAQIDLAFDAGAKPVQVFLPLPGGQTINIATAATAGEASAVFVSGLTQGQIEALNDAVTQAQGAAQTAANIEAGLPTAIADAVASNEVVVDAAALAVTDATSALDIVTGGDSRLLAVTDATEYAIPLVDESGRVAGGVTAAGRFNLERPGLVMGQEGTAIEPAVAPGWAWAITDRDGFVALGVRDDGRVVASGISSAESQVGLTRSRRDAVAAFGDSLTAGFFGGSSGPAEDSWPAKLGEELAVRATVTNLAVSGHTVDEVAIRVGAYPMHATFIGGQIPASGAVTLTLAEAPGMRGPARSFPGSFAGVPGTLTFSAEQWSFTRTTPGEAVPVAPGASWNSMFHDHLGDTVVVMAGRNDLNGQIAGPEGDVVEHVVAGIRRIVSALTRDMRQVLVMSVTSTTTEVQGTSGYARVSQINAALAREWGPRFLDIRGWLITNGMSALDLTPTSADQTALAGDTLPPSLMDPGDTTHWSKSTAALVAGRILDYFDTRDWIRS